MKTSRIVAGSGTVLLHALAIGVAFLLGPSVHVVPMPRPVEVSLVRPPPPPPPPPVVEPPRRPEPLPVRPPTRTPVAPAPPPRPREEPAPRPPQPAPSARPEPPPAPAAAPVVAARPIDEARPAGITAAAAPAAAPVAPQVADGTSAGTAKTPPPPAPVRSGPRLDASWSGNAPPPYPSMARRLGEEGEVQLDVRVGPDGAVIDVRLKKSSGSQLLDQTAIDTVKKWRFRPATVDGQPVAEWYYNWKWVFKLES